MATSPSAIVDAIDAAILEMMSSGAAQTVEVGGRKVIYHDLLPLERARDYYQTKADAAAGTVRTRLTGITYGETS